MKAQDLIQIADPWQIFKTWFEEARQVPTIKEANAMTLATADQNGRPAARTVLLKRFSESHGFVFYTNYDSHKAKDIKSNPQAALLFYWEALYRQVRITGTVTALSREESKLYWDSRPWDSQLAGYVSRQSEPILGSLEEEMKQARLKWQGKAIPCPENWGGFSVHPQAFEFWMGHQFRMHERVLFTESHQSWIGRQLYP